MPPQWCPSHLVVHARVVQVHAVLPVLLVVSVDNVPREPRAALLVDGELLLPVLRVLTPLGQC